jgi:hypothetical protein
VRQQAEARRSAVTATGQNWIVAGRRRRLDRAPFEALNVPAIFN